MWLVLLLSIANSQASVADLNRQERRVGLFDQVALELEIIVYSDSFQILILNLQQFYTHGITNSL